MTPAATDPIRRAVQRNCDISDARHAARYTLCVYLLKMREFFRWERGYPFSAAMPRDEIGSWLSGREELWESLEHEPYTPIPVDGMDFDPFATAAINDHINASGYVYSGGIGQRATPHFFFGRLERRIDADGYRILVSAQEYARDLTAPPAMTLGRDIFVRSESIKRMLWEKVQEWRWHRYDNAMGRALAYYDLDDDLETSLDRMTTHEIDPIIHHEIGETRAGELLGDRWEDMLSELAGSRAEVMARAIRDLLADCLVTLPRLHDTRNEASLHFYMANLTAMRKDLFPGFSQAYAAWAESGDMSPIRQVAERGAARWLATGQQMLELYAGHAPTYTDGIERLVEANRL